MMKLVEVVVLLGTQCISPVDTAPNMTFAGKVPCAVLIHQDTDDNRVQIVPAGAASHPTVQQALLRIAGIAQPVPVPPPEPAAEAPAEAPVISDDPPITVDSTPPALPRVAQAGAAPASRVVVEWPPAPEAGDEQPQPAPEAGAVVAEAVPEPEPAPEPEAAEVPEAALPEPQPEPAAEAPPVEEPEPAAEAPPAEEPPPKKVAPKKAAPKKAASRKTRRTATTDPAIARQTNSLKTVCRYPRVAQWYKNKSGNLKYRCVTTSKQAVY